MNQFTGAGVAIITPFKEDKSIDFKALERLVNHLIDRHISYLVVLGTTGESVTLTKDERVELIEFIVQVNGGRIPVVLGMGGNDTRKVVQEIETSKLSGIDAFLSVAPYYNKPGQQGLYEHYKALAEASPIPLILYNVPGSTGVNISAETTLKLAHEFRNIIAIKEASGDLIQAARVVKDKPADFLVISGDDALILPIISQGGAGVISVLANAFPGEVSQLVSLALRNQFKEARDIYFRFSELIPLLFTDGNPAGIKAILHIQKRISNILRLPLTPVKNSVYSSLERLIS